MWEKVGTEKFMSSYFFSGSTVAKLDEKNRFVIPQEMRYGLVENGKLEFAIGIGLGGCLSIYKKSDIDQIVEKFKSSQYVAKYQKFFTLFFSTLYFCTCDKLGRVTIPNHLREVAKIGKELVVAGVLNKIELWPKELYDASMATLISDGNGQDDLKKMTEEAFLLLNEQAAVDMPHE